MSRPEKPMNASKEFEQTVLAAMEKLINGEKPVPPPGSATGDPHFTDFCGKYIEKHPFGDFPIFSVPRSRVHVRCESVKGYPRSVYADPSWVRQVGIGEDVVANGKTIEYGRTVFKIGEGKGWYYNGEPISIGEHGTTLPTVALLRKVSSSRYEYYSFIGKYKVIIYDCGLNISVHIVAPKGTAAAGEESMLGGLYAKSGSLIQGEGVFEDTMKLEFDDTKDKHFEDFVLLMSNGSPTQQDIINAAADFDRQIGGVSEEVVMANTRSMYNAIDTHAHYSGVSVDEQLKKPAQFSGSNNSNLNYSSNNEHVAETFINNLYNLKIIEFVNGSYYVGLCRYSECDSESVVTWNATLKDAKKLFKQELSKYVQSCIEEKKAAQILKLLATLPVRSTKLKTTVSVVKDTTQDHTIEVKSDDVLFPAGINGFNIELPGTSNKLSLEYMARFSNSENTRWTCSGNWLKKKDEKLTGVAFKLGGVEAQNFSVHYQLFYNNHHISGKDGEFCGGDEEKAIGLKVTVLPK